MSLSFTTSAAAGDAAALQAAGATASGFKCYAFYFDATPLTLAGPCRAEWQAAAFLGAPIAEWVRLRCKYKLSCQHLEH